MNWIDIIPAIPLARGVPVRGLGFAKGDWSHGVAMQTESLPEDWDWQGQRETRFRIATRDTRHANWYWKNVRVDLDDPQGFAYAVRHWSQHHDDESGEAEEQALQWALSYLGGGITDADRVALAKALAEVVNAK